MASNTQTGSGQWANVGNADNAPLVSPAPDPDNRYAVPDAFDGNAPYIKAFGWAPTLRLDVDSIPDTGRLGTSPNRTFRPAADVPPAEGFYADREADTNSRESVTNGNAVGWAEQKGVYPTDMRAVDNPRRTPPPEARPTQQMGPNTYSFSRPFGHNQPKQSEERFNGLHFSMAAHRRNYEIYGMQPVKQGRNTFRIEPQPWDQNLVDLPPDQSYAQGAIQSVDVTTSGPSNGYRLM